MAPANKFNISNTPKAVPLFALSDFVWRAAAPSPRPGGGPPLPTLPLGSFVAAGGGGSAKSGVGNQVIVSIVETRPTGVQAEERLTYSTGEQLATSVDLSVTRRLLALSVDAGCLILGCVAGDAPGSRHLVRLCFTETDFPATPATAKTAPGGRDEPPPRGCQNVARFSPVQEDIVVTGGDDGTLRMWQVTVPNLTAVEQRDAFDEGAEQPEFVLAQVLQMRAHTGPIKDVSFHPSGRLVATSSSDGTCRIWSLESGKTLQILPADSAGGLTYRSIRFSARRSDLLFTLQVPTGRHGSSQIVVWRNEAGPDALDSKKWGLARAVAACDCRGTAFSVSSDGRYLAVGDVKGTISLYDQQTLELHKRIPEVHALAVTGLTFAPAQTPEAAAQPETDEMVVRPLSHSHVVSSSADRTIAMVPLAGKGQQGWGVCGLLFLLVLFVASMWMAFVLALLVAEGGLDDPEAWVARQNVGDLVLPHHLSERLRGAFAGVA